MLTTYTENWLKLPLILLLLSLSSALKSAGKATDEKEDALIYEIEMGDMNSKEINQNSELAVAKEQFKFEYFGRAQ
jgi:hypothetical protein